MIPGQEYSFYIHEENDKTYLCIECPSADERKMSMAAVQAYLESRGLTITPKTE